MSKNGVNANNRHLKTFCSLEKVIKFDLQCVHVKRVLPCKKCKSSKSLNVSNDLTIANGNEVISSHDAGSKTNIKAFFVSYFV